MDGLSIQQRFYPGLTCFGCGHANAEGLRLQSYADGAGGVVASFTPRPAHDNGLGYLNGGIISTVLDCHSAAAVILEAETRGWPSLPGAAMPYVTARLDVRYLRPTPLHATSELRGHVITADEDAMTAEVELVVDDKVRAAATAVWKRWRPR